MILYFSGTGNSRYAAELISLVAGDELISINDLIKRGKTAALKSAKPFVFVVPVYAGRMPRIVEKYIVQTEFKGNKDAYFIATCANTPWITDSYAAKLAAKKGWSLRGFQSIVMPQNYIAMYDIPSPAEADELIAAATPRIRAIGETIKSGQSLAKEEPGKAIMSKLINPIMYATMVNAKGFHVTDACKGCGRCTVRCPLNNIKLSGGKPIWGKDCTHCMACINGCPSSAIQYGKKSAGRNRYYNEKKPQL